MELINYFFKTYREKGNAPPWPVPRQKLELIQSLQNEQLHIPLTTTKDISHIYKLKKSKSN